MRFAANAEGILAADIERVLKYRNVAEGRRMPLNRFARNLAQADAFDLRVCACEITFDERRSQTNGIKDLSAAIGLIGRDAHLGHDLEHGFAERLDEALLDVVLADVCAKIGQHFIECFEREVRVDGFCAIARERAELVDLVSFARFDDETDGGSQALLDQVVMHGRCREERRDRNAIRARGAVGEDDDVVLASAHEFFRFRAHAIECWTHTRFALVGGVCDVDRDRRKIVILDGADAADALQVFVGQDRLINFKALFLRRAFKVQNVRARADERHEAHDELFADAVDRRVRHLREVLLEVGVE